MKQAANITQSNDVASRHVLSYVCHRCECTSCSMLHASRLSIAARLVSLSSPLISCAGSSPLRLTGVGLYTPSHTALVSFRAHEQTHTVHGVYDATMECITCDTPPLHGAHEALVRVSTDDGAHWSNPLALHVSACSMCSVTTSAYVCHQSFSALHVCTCVYPR